MIQRGEESIVERTNKRRTHSATQTHARNWLWRRMFLLTDVFRSARRVDPPSTHTPFLGRLLQSHFHNVRIVAEPRAVGEAIKSRRERRHMFEKIIIGHIAKWHHFSAVAGPSCADASPSSSQNFSGDNERKKVRDYGRPKSDRHSWMKRLPAQSMRRVRARIRRRKFQRQKNATSRPAVVRKNLCLKTGCQWEE